ncbi:methyltransferase [Thermococcus indicus]|uniref:Methyltransferase n=1 Tax=Thermococcus indicus TaxID=2586643 RepID=A0A4Y5SK55_9EURY|nr:methyltransferase [Thermococcus indicus]QDA30582.1 methyltransferase [Thermococcus indicus]
MKPKAIVILGILAVLIATTAGKALFTDAVTSRGTIETGEFSIGISKDGSRFYRDVKAFEFSDMKPGDEETVILTVKNRGDVPVSKVSLTFHVQDYEVGELSPAERSIDDTPDEGELSRNIIVVEMTVEGPNGEQTVREAAGVSLARLSGKSIPIFRGSLTPGQTMRIRIRFALPKTVGNECQTDGVKVNLTVSAEQ